MSDAGGPPSLDATLEASDSEEAAPTPENGEVEKRSRKRRASEDCYEGETKGRKLTKQEEMQLKLLANLPSAQQPLRDRTGRRRATCISSTEIVEAGLSGLVAGASTDGASREEEAAEASPAESSEHEDDAQQEERTNSADAEASM